MKISSLTNDIIIKYCNAYEEDIDLLILFKESAISYIKGQTGLDDIQLNSYEDITLALLTLISDMYDNRSIQVEKNNFNKIIDSILFMHSTNLL